MVLAAKKKTMTRKKQNKKWKIQNIAINKSKLLQNKNKGVFYFVR